ASQEHCKFFSMMSQGYLDQIRSDAGYERKKMVMETQFSPGQSVPEAIAPAGLRLFSRQVGRLTVSESGKALKCDVIKTEGPQPPIDDCSDLLGDRFEALGIEVGAVEATVARNIFIGD
ncbi:MAG TPA: hypothetical protein VFR36_09355, partial [Sphingomicrobium sp.]|nr:hypothetical protein [Sphingomicrobium sp.]